MDIRLAQERHYIAQSPPMYSILLAEIKAEHKHKKAACIPYGQPLAFISWTNATFYLHNFEFSKNVRQKDV